MHKEYILLNGFRKAKRGFTAGFHVPLSKYNPKVYDNEHPLAATNCVIHVERFEVIPSIG